MKTKAFTLIEIIIVIGITAFVAGGVFLALSSFIVRNQFSVKVGETVQSLRKAQAYSMMRIENSKWGVKFDSAVRRVIFFKGVDYAARDTRFDEIVELPQVVSLSDISLNGSSSEVVFSKTTGETAQFGSLTMNSDIGEEISIKINSLGQIETN